MPYWRNATPADEAMGCAAHVPSTRCFGRWNNCRPYPARETECECLPGQVCPPCKARGYTNGLAGYAARIYPDRVTPDDVAEQERADRAAQNDA